MTVRTAIDAHLAAVRKPAPDTRFDALAEVARSLADAIDAPDTDPRSLPTLARELRSVLDDVTPREDGDAFDALAAELSAKVEHSPHP